MEDNQLHLESQIIDTVFTDNKNTVHFDYEEHKRSKGNVVEWALNVMTFNPDHEQSFLLHRVTGTAKAGVLTKIIYYLEEDHKEEPLWEVQWRIRGNDTMRTSHFKGHDLRDVLYKFYFNKEDPDDLTIYQIELSISK